MLKSKVEEVRQALPAARLYWLTPDWEPQRMVPLADRVLEAGIDMLQLRHKSLERGELLAIAYDLASRCRAAGTLFIVNDHLGIALLSSADGVHLGPDDLRVESARRVAGSELLIGASASTPAAAVAAVESGADYIGAGPAFATPVKSEKRVIGPAGVAAVAAAVHVPVFAIGGIDATNVDDLRAVGVDRVCVIRGIADAEDPAAAVRELRQKLR
jgi:thiamine-phosphate pyrophosphorylase